MRIWFYELRNTSNTNKVQPQIHKSIEIFNKIKAIFVSVKCIK